MVIPLKNRPHRTSTLTRAAGLIVFAVVPAFIFAACNDFFTKDIELGTKGSTTGGGGGGTDTPDEVDDDNDGLGNSVEELFKIDPRVADTDEDGFSDGLEFVGEGGDPLNGSDTPTSASRERIVDAADGVQNDSDRDRDGLGDTFEKDNSLDPDDADTDGDGYQDGLELVALSDPFVNDDRPTRDTPPTSDGATRSGTPPADADNDGVSDEQEQRDGTETNSSDSDGDGFSDGLEFLMGSKATSNLSIPNFSVPTPPATTTTTAGSTTTTTSGSTTTTSALATIN